MIKNIGWLGFALSYFMVTGISQGQEAPTPTPSPIPLDPQFQPGVYQPGDMTVLERIEFVPPGSGPFPIALVVHPGGFHGGTFNAADMTPVYRDLVNARFLVFGISYRLAPPGMITGQSDHDLDPTSGRPPEQSNDMKQHVLSARADLRGNGTVIVVGGSAGGSHGVWVAIDTASQGGLAWVALNRVNATSSLSGAYDYSKIDPNNPDNGPPELVRKFRQAILNYTNLTRFQIAQLYALSPVALATNSDVKPLQLLDSTNDPQPAPQRMAMTDALMAHGVMNFQSFTPQGSQGHAFDYWRTIDPATGLTIGQEVINFLNANIPPH